MKLDLCAFHSYLNLVIDGSPDSTSNQGAGPHQNITTGLGSQSRDSSAGSSAKFMRYNCPTLLRQANVNEEDNIDGSNNVSISGLGSVAKRVQLNFSNLQENDGSV